MTMRVLLILAAISFSAAAFAQTGTPKVGDKPMVQVKPKGPTGCKLELSPNFGDGLAGQAAAVLG